MFSQVIDKKKFIRNTKILHHIHINSIICLSMNESITLDSYCIDWINGKTFYPNNDPDQSKCHINIGLFYSEVFENIHTNKTMICSSNNQLFLIILKYLQCRYDLIRFFCLLIKLRFYLKSKYKFH